MLKKRLTFVLIICSLMITIAGCGGLGETDDEDLRDANNSRLMWGVMINKMEFAAKMIQTMCRGEEFGVFMPISGLFAKTPNIGPIPCVGQEEYVAPTNPDERQTFFQAYKVNDGNRERVKIYVPIYRDPPIGHDNLRLIRFQGPPSQYNDYVFGSHYIYLDPEDLDETVSTQKTLVFKSEDRILNKLVFDIIPQLL